MYRNVPESLSDQLVPLLVEVYMFPFWQHANLVPSELHAAGFPPLAAVLVRAVQLAPESVEM